MPPMPRVLVTGASSGLGWHTARYLAGARADFEVLLGCRTEAKARAAAESILADTAPDVSPELECASVTR